jgi:hypothetical protein
MSKGGEQDDPFTLKHGLTRRDMLKTTGATPRY